MDNNILNPVNDRNINLITIIIAIQLALWGSIGLDSIGISIPVLRQLIGFGYISFIPGYLVLKALKIRDLGSIRTLLYCTGLSLSILMTIGFILNTIGPLMGILDPISIEPIMITITILVLVLTIVLYIMGENRIQIDVSDVKSITSRPILLLLLLYPFVAIFGTRVMNLHGNNALLLLLIIAIGVIALLISSDKLIKPNLYPIAIFIVALTLLYHTSLISPYVWGWDIQEEYFFSNLVKLNSIWDSSFMSRNCNAMLSLVSLVPIYSIILNMNLDQILKIVVPFLFAFVPLGLYSVIQEQTNDKIAFFSCFYFVSYLTFYTEMLALARQQIAELFFVLILLAIFDRKLNNSSKSLFGMIFAFSLIVSHYGLAYIYIFVILFAYCINFAAKNINLIRILAIRAKTSEPIKYLFPKKNRESIYQNRRTAQDISVSMTFIIMCITFMLLWYISFSDSSSFNEIISLLSRLSKTIFSEFAKAETAQGLEIITLNSLPIMKLLLKYILILSQGFIFVGLIVTVLKKSKYKFNHYYLLLSLVFFLLCLAGIVVPYFASSLNTSRIFHISLLLLSPFCVIGGIYTFGSVNRIVKRITKSENLPKPFTALSVFLVVFLLLNSGFAGEILKNGQSSIALTQNLDYPLFMDKDYYGILWLTSFKENNIIFADNYGSLLLKRFLGPYYGTDNNPFAPRGDSHERYWIFQGKIFDETHNIIANQKNPAQKIYYNGGIGIYGAEII